MAPRQATSISTGRAREPIIPALAWPVWVSAALAVVTAAAMAVTFFVPVSSAERQ